MTKIEKEKKIQMEIAAEAKRQQKIEEENHKTIIPGMDIGNAGL